MKRKRLGSAIKNGVLFTLLAVLCIGGMELAVCRFADPGLYGEIVAPVETLYHNVSAEVHSAAEAAQTRIAQLQAEARARAEERARLRALELARRQEEERLRALELARAQAEAEAALAAAALQDELPEGTQVAGSPAIQIEFIPADPAITELVEFDGQEYLLGGNFSLPYFNQADEAWAKKPFGIDPVGTHGCGPTSMAMVVSALTGETINPGEMASWAARAGYAAPHSGSYLSIVEGTAEAFGLDCAPLEELTAETLCGRLREGAVIVALMGPGHFTRGGHFIVLHGITLSGEILVADPYSRENSLMTWDPELILKEASISRFCGAPLWVVTAPAEL